MSAVKQAAQVIAESLGWPDASARQCAQTLADAALLRDEPDTCGWCGKPAEGLATVGSVRYCHGEDDDPTCYQKRHWAGSTMAPFARAEPVTVTTVEELDALPSGSVVLTADHVALQKDRHGRWGEGLSMPSTLVAELAWKPATVLYQPHRNLT